MKKRTISLFILITFLLSSCASAKATVQPASTPNQMLFENSAKTSLDREGIQSAPSGAAEQEAPSTGSSSSEERIVIKTASLSIVVEDPNVAMDRVISMTSQMKGWVVSSNLYKVTTSQGTTVPQASITIRVPAESLDDAMKQIKALVKNPQEDVRNEMITGQDVTSEYTDLQSKLANLEVAEAQLKEIMASAKKTEDVMAVFNQLTEIRSQIEVIKGQMKYYEQSSAYSSISVEIISAATIQPLTVGGWKPEGVVRDAVQALIDTLKGIANVLIWFIIVVLPVLVILYLFVRLVIWIIHKLFPKKKKNDPPAAPSGDAGTK